MTIRFLRAQPYRLELAGQHMDPVAGAEGLQNYRGDGIYKEGSCRAAVIIWDSDTVVHAVHQGSAPTTPPTSTKFLC